MGLKNILENRKLLKRINTLENQNEELQNIIKDHLYSNFMETANYEYIIDRLTTENKKLKSEIKKLKEKAKKDK